MSLVAISNQDQQALDDCLCELTALTDLSVDEWNDFLALPPEGQRLIADGYKGMSWTQSPDILSRVLSVLTLVGNLAGAVSGVGGAIAAIKSL